MKSPSDTERAAGNVQLQLLRAKTPSQRSRLVCSMTHTAIFHAKRAIERAHPGLNQQDRDLLFIKVHYGNELADEVRAYRQEHSL
jgi:hypothetical protein